MKTVSLESEKEKYQRYLAGREWGLLKNAVHERSNGICERCRSNKLDHVHHLTYIRKYHERLEDLQAICKQCHEFTHGLSDYDPKSLGDSLAVALDKLEEQFRQENIEAKKIFEIERKNRELKEYINSDRCKKTINEYLRDPNKAQVGPYSFREITKEKPLTKLEIHDRKVIKECLEAHIIWETNGAKPYKYDYSISQYWNAIKMCGPFDYDRIDLLREMVVWDNYCELDELYPDGSLFGVYFEYDEDRDSRVLSAIDKYKKPYLLGIREHEGSIDIWANDEIARKEFGEIEIESDIWCLSNFHYNPFWDSSK